MCSNEADIDLAIEKFKLKSFKTAKRLMQAGIQRVGGFVTNTALSSGGGLVQQFQRAYSMVDLTQTLKTLNTLSEQEGGGGVCLNGSDV